MITFNNGLGPLKTKSRGGIPEWGDVLDGDFVLRILTNFEKVIKLSYVRHHMVESRSLNGCLTEVRAWKAFSVMSSKASSPNLPTSMNAV